MSDITTSDAVDKLGKLHLHMPREFMLEFSAHLRLENDGGVSWRCSVCGLSGGVCKDTPIRYLVESMYLTHGLHSPDCKTAT